MLYTAIKSFKATKDDEITVNIGTVVEVLQQSENGWWLIRYTFDFWLKCLTCIFFLYLC